MGHERLVHEFDQTSMVMWSIIACHMDEKKARGLQPLQFNPYRNAKKKTLTNRQNFDIGVGSEKAFEMMKKAFAEG